MRANEFVKLVGWDAAVVIINGVPDKYRFQCLSAVCWDSKTHKYSDRFKPRDSLINMSWLKRLVESHELVESFGGIDAIKEKYANRPFDLAWSDLKQAITDVESCL